MRDCFGLGHAASDILEALTSPVDRSHRGRYWVLRKENLSPFMDYDELASRVAALSEHATLGARAKKLSEAFADARD